MKKLLLSFMLMTGVGMMFAQTNWSDDFESYSPGDFIGVVGDDWTTWSGAAGGADDSAVSDEEAYSGTNSLKLTSFSSTGGPADIVLPFAERYTSGGFTFEMWMYVVEGTGAYFNFQAESTVGVNWAQETVFNSDGSLIVRSNNTQPISGTYEQDKWFKVEWLLDLDNNKWELIVDGQCLGFFENNWNTVASLNIYPVSDNNQSVYFVDDVSWSHDPNGLSDVQFDAGVSGLSLKTRTIAGTELPIAGTIQNNGSEAITSFKVLFDDGVSPVEKEFSGINLLSGESYDFDLGETYLAQEGTVDVSLSIVEVNGQSDQRDCNDVKNASVSGIVPAQYKKVLVEEATGTWCTWCPRGDVFLRWMTRDYPDYFVPIAVHQGDPMANNHIDFVRQTTPGFGGYPNMLIERKEWFSFGTVADVENRFFDQIVEEVDGYMEIGAQWDETTRQLDVSTAVNFVGGTGGNYSIDIVLVETGINKDSAGYQQTNAYAGGGRGPMGGYENLPSPVPAKDMIYNHVSRGSLTGDFSGIDLSGYTSGERPVVNFSSKVNRFWDAEKFYLVAVLTNADGSVNNVEEVTLQDAMDFGFEASTVSAEDVAAVEGALVFPNPANNQTFVEMSLIRSAEVTISVINSLGEVVAYKNHGQLEGDYVFPVDLGNMPSGTYHVRLQAGNQFKTTTLNVIH